MILIRPVTLSKEFANLNFTQAYSLRIDFDVKQKITAGKYTHSILLLTSDTSIASPLINHRKSLKTGIIECWNSGKFHSSIIPTFHYSIFPRVE